MGHGIGHAHVIASLAEEVRNRVDFCPGSGSLFSPVATIGRAASGKGLCNAAASLQSALSQTSHSSVVVSITGMALGWIGATTVLGAVVKNP